VVSKVKPQQYILNEYCNTGFKSGAAAIADAERWLKMASRKYKIRLYKGPDGLSEYRINHTVPFKQPAIRIGSCPDGYYWWLQALSPYYGQ
jgi:hypothetical protein